MQHSPSEIKEKLLKALDKEYNVVDMATVVEIITILERTVITKEALETTRLGKYINELRRKTTDELLAKRAKDLVRRWRDMIQENNHVSGGGASSSRVPLSTPPLSQNGPYPETGPLVSPALRSNVSPGLSQLGNTSRHSPSSSPSLRCIQNRVISPMNSFSPNLHLAQSSLSSDSNSKPKFHGTALPDPSGHQFHPSVAVNIDPVPKTHASNKRLRKGSPSSSDGPPAKRRSCLNGQVARALELDLHGDGSRDSISGLSQSSSSCEIISSSLNKVPILESVFDTVASVTTATCTVTTITTATTTCTSFHSVTTTTTSTTCMTATAVPANLFNSSCSEVSSLNASTAAMAVDNTGSTSIARINPTGTNCSANISTPKTRGRKKQTKNCLSDGVSVVLSGSGNDILKEKIASKARTPKVKTTQELVASVQGKVSGVEGVSENKVPSNQANKTSLNESIFVKWGPPSDALEVTRNKNEHIAKFLQSQSELHHMQEDPSIAPLADVEELRLQKNLGGPSNDNSSENDILSPTGTGQLSKDTQQSVSSKDSLSASAVATIHTQDQTVEEILSQLPPLDVDAIIWDDSDDADADADAETPPEKEVTEDVISKLHCEHIEGLNGNINEGAKPGETDFREWHETLSKKSYQGEFLHILPYVIID